VEFSRNGLLTLFFPSLPLFHNSLSYRLYAAAAAAATAVAFLSYQNEISKNGARVG
jgi:hypothetical protein